MLAKSFEILYSSMTADEEVESNASNCRKPKLNDDLFADMRDGGALSIVTHSTDELTAEDKLAKYKTLRLPPTSRKNPLLFWREKAFEFSLMSATVGRIYSISASFTQSKRDFSSLGHTMTDVCSMLSAGRVETNEIDQPFQLVWLTRHRNCISTEITELTEKHCLI
jgi:hypothetical protein